MPCTKIAITGCLLISATMSHAQDSGVFFGGRTGYTDTTFLSETSTSAAIGNPAHLTQDLFAGVSLGDGSYSGIEMRYSEAYTGHPGKFGSGQTIGLRLGHDFGGSNAELVMGQIDVNSEPNQNSERSYYGLAFGSMMDDATNVTGQILFLDGGKGTDGNGLDALRDAVLIEAGFGTQMGEGVQVRVGGHFGSGTVDTDSDSALMLGYSAKVGLELIPDLANLSINFEHTSYNQPAELNSVEEVTLGASLDFSFGSGGQIGLMGDSRWQPLLPLDKIVVTTGGVLE